MVFRKRQSHGESCDRNGQRKHGRQLSVEVRRIVEAMIGRTFQKAGRRHRRALLAESLESRVLLSGPDTTSPTILNTRLENTTLIVTFSEDMAVSGPGSVLDKANWRVRSNAADAILSSAKITFRLNSLNNQYEARIPVSILGPGQLFTAFASGTIQDLSGNNLDGDNDLNPGGDYFWTPVSNASVAGQPDPKFGLTGGTSLVNYFVTAPSSDLAAQVFHNVSTGKYTILGTSSAYDPTLKKSVDRIAILQYNADGKLDTTFGAGSGKVFTVLNGSSFAMSALIVDPTHGILVGGSYRDATTQKDTIVVARYKLDGSPLASFGTTGVATRKFTISGAQADCSVSGMVIDPTSGRILLASTLRGSFDVGIVTALKLGDGTLDTTFNGTGLQDFGAQGWTASSKIFRQDDGTILLAGKVSLGSGFFGVGIARLKADGTLDTTFAGGGATSFDDRKNVSGGAFSLLVRNSRIYVFSRQTYVPDSSRYGEHAETRVSTLRLQLNGTRDASFGTNGISYSPWLDGYVSDATLDQSGNLLAVGQQSLWIYDASGPQIVDKAGAEGRFWYIDPVSRATVMANLKERSPTSVIVSADAKMFAVGSFYNPNNGSSDFWAVRFNSSFTVDGSFGEAGSIVNDTNGILFPLSNSATSIARQGDGKLIVAGSVWNGYNYDVAVSRLNFDGSLDTDFGIGGRYVYARGPGDDVATAVAIQPGGKIVVLVNTEDRANRDISSFLILRLTTTGELEKVFVDPFTGLNRNAAYDLEMLPDGKMIVVGKWKQPITPGLSYYPSDFSVFKLDASLNLDPSFGAARSGIASFSVGGNDDVATSVTVDSQGRIYVAGWSKSTSTSLKAASVLRLTSAGIPDTTYNGTGIRTQVLGISDAIPKAIAVDSSSRLIIASDVKRSSGNAAALIRLTSFGQTDTSLIGNGAPDANGVVYPAEMTKIAGVAIQPDGKIVVAGNYGTTVPFVRIMKFDSNGVRDASFKISAWDEFHFTGTNFYPSSMMLLPDGKIAVVGQADPVSGDSDSADFAVVMAQGEGPPTVTIAPLTPVAAGNQQGFTLKAFDPSPEDNLGYFVYNIDWNGDADGKIEFVDHAVGTSQTTFSHAFPAPGTYKVTVEARDRTGKAGPWTTILVTVPEDDAPVVTETATPLSYTENQAPLLLAPNATVSDQLSPDFAGGKLTVSLTGAFQSEDLLSIRNQGTAAGQINLNGSSVYYGSTVIGTFSGGNGNNPLVITLNGSASPLATQALLRNLAFEVVSENPNTSQRSVQIVLDDGDGKFSDPLVKTISITAVNDAPNDIGLSNRNVRENDASGTFVGDFGTTDPDGESTFTYALVAGPGDTGNASFMIDGNKLKTASSFDFEAQPSYSILVRTTDPGGLSCDKAFTISVINLLEVTEGNDYFVIVYSTADVSVSRSINGGPATNQGVFTLSEPLTLSGLMDNDRVRIEGTAGNDVFQAFDSQTYSINGALLQLAGPAAKTLAGVAGNDNYVFDADITLGALSIDETSGGIDTLDFSATTTVGLYVNIGSAAVQIIDPTNLSLNLNSGFTIENIIGGSGNDILVGNSLANTLTGNAGNDKLTGASGSDTLIGGLGDDTYLFAGASAAEADQTHEQANEGLDTLSFSGLSTSVVMSVATSAVQSVHLNRTLKLNTSSTFEHLIGGNAADTLTGNALNNTLIGGPGNDKLTGAGGSDNLFGGLDADTYFFGIATSAEGDQVHEKANEGADTLNFSALTTSVIVSVATSAVQNAHVNRTIKLSTSSSVENIVGGNAADSLTGNSLNNSLSGGPGADNLAGAGGSNILLGGLHDDTYVFAAATSVEADEVHEKAGEGVDTISFSNLAARVVVSLGTSAVQSVDANRSLKLNTSSTFENVIGGSGDDSLTGNNEANVLIGNGGNDLLNGADGNDILIGGTGGDTLNGAAGEDILLAGTTSYDSLFAQLNSLRVVWTGSASYSSRVASLRTGTGAPVVSLKTGTTVFSDALSVDTLVGGTESDWFLAALNDLFTNRTISEELDLL